MDLESKLEQDRSLRFPPPADEHAGTIGVEFEIVNESYSGALLKLRLNRTKQVTVIPKERAPCPARIARVEYTEDGSLLLGVTWDCTGVPLTAAKDANA